jgi:hypothetical protein
MEHIVTSEELWAGNLEYRECGGTTYVVEHGWHVLRRLPDGNYLVREPELQEMGDYELPCSQASDT